MKIIDDRGKLFGIINIVDLIVLILLMTVVMVGVGKFTGRATRNEPGTIPVNLEVLISEVRQQTVQAIKVGDQVMDATSSSVVGTIKDKKVVPFRRPAETGKGGFVLAEVPERFDIYLELECNGHDTGSVLRIASYEIRIGTTMILRTRDYAVAGIVLRKELDEQKISSSLYEQ
ncbi:MAG: DUF4330 domain-containing protein [Dethiobacteria bacterium]